MKNEIVKTRNGNFGSSDAAMIAHAGKTKQVSEQLKQRIAVLLGLSEKQEVTTKAIRLGNEMEERYYNAIKLLHPEAQSNPLFVSKWLIHENFKVINHIDVEVIEKNRVIWHEVKTTGNAIDKVQDDYKYQLQWHYMLLKERAAALGLKKYTLLLSVIDSDTGVVSSVEINENSVIIGEILVGLQVTDVWISENRDKIKLPDVVDFEAMPAIQAEAIMKLHDVMLKMEQMRALEEELKERLRVVMEENGIKTIKSELITLTYVAPSQSVSFDSTRFKKENPELAKQYEKITERGSYVKIIIKK